jgi:hypothetical protein
MVTRAKYVTSIFKQHGITVISPVIEEEVQNESGELIQTSQETLKGFWERDKSIIAYRAHVVFLDEAERKSLGCEREYGFARYCLWKPCVTLLPSGGPSVADFEDDTVAHDLHHAAEVMVTNWGTPLKRVKWRILMLLKSLPLFVFRQIYQFR